MWTALRGGMGAGDKAWCESAGLRSVRVVLVSSLTVGNWTVMEVKGHLS